MIVSSAASRTLFVYGTLTAPEVMKALVGRLPPFRSARLDGFTRHPVVGFVFPGIIPVKDETATPRPVQGLLYTDLTVDELEILDWFEDVEYTRSVVQVKDDETNELCDTQVYVWINPLEELDLTQDWDYDQFRTQHLSNYLVNTVAPCRIEFERMKKESS